ncbi:MAG: hypothetical protein WD751_07670 [Anaerolineales bacterium]
MESICNKMFFSDFTVRNPSFTKPDRKRREAADILVLFGSVILAIQVKSKREIKKASEKDEHDFSRIIKVVEDGIRQLGTTKRAIDNGWLDQVRSGKGMEISTEGLEKDKFIGIVILDLIGEELFEEGERSRLYGLYLGHKGYPIHVLTRDDFDSLSTELDTLPDFIRFLGVVKSLHEAKLLVFPIQCLDLLAIYKMNPELISKAMIDNVHLSIGDDIWREYHQKFNHSIMARNELNKNSYLIDEIIDFLHSSVGFYPVGEALSSHGLKGEGTVEGYLKVAKELAGLTRLERRRLGDKLVDCLQRGEKTGLSYSVVRNEDSSNCVLILCSKLERIERAQFLYKLCGAAYCYLGLSKIVGISTETSGAPLRSYDAMVLEEVEFSNAKELSEQARKLFGVERRLHDWEYTDPDSH